MKKESPVNVNERMKNYRKRKVEDGFYWLCHWVPAEHKDKIVNYAKRLRGK